MRFMSGRHDEHVLIMLPEASRLRRVIRQRSATASKPTADRPRPPTAQGGTVIEIDLAGGQQQSPTSPLRRVPAGPHWVQVRPIDHHPTFQTGVAVRSADAQRPRGRVRATLDPERIAVEVVFRLQDEHGEWLYGLNWPASTGPALPRSEQLIATTSATRIRSNSRATLPPRPRSCCLVEALGITRLSNVADLGDGRRGRRRLVGVLPRSDRPRSDRRTPGDQRRPPRARGRDLGGRRRTSAHSHLYLATSTRGIGPS